MGNTLQIDADIQYPNGNEVQFGMYSAAIFPLEAINDAFNAESEEYIPLQYNPADQLWEGVAYMPSYLDSGSLDPYISGPYSYPGPYYLTINGISADGLPSGNILSTGGIVDVQPGFLLQITSPTTNIVNTTSSSFMISGKTTGLEVTINGVSQSLTSSGEFVAIEDLQPGFNTFTIVATDEFYMTETQTVTVYYQPASSNMTSTTPTTTSEPTEFGLPDWEVTLFIGLAAGLISGAIISGLVIRSKYQGPNDHPPNYPSGVQPRSGPNTPLNNPPNNTSNEPHMNPSDSQPRTPNYVPSWRPAEGQPQKPTNTEPDDEWDHPTQNDGKDFL